MSSLMESLHHKKDLRLILAGKRPCGLLVMTCKGSSKIAINASAHMRCDRLTFNDFREGAMPVWSQTMRAPAAVAEAQAAQVARTDGRQQRQARQQPSGLAPETSRLYFAPQRGSCGSLLLLGRRLMSPWTPGHWHRPLRNKFPDLVQLEGRSIAGDYTITFT